MEKYLNTFSHREVEPEDGVLYIVGTPIGNLKDISFRAINVLKKVSLIACEDTRVTKKLLKKYEISNKTISFFKHNAKDRIPKILEELKQQKSIALVSDAGLPSISDPGEYLINEAKNNDLQVICIPGPCAALTALVSSGFSSSSFVFEGFLPRVKTERIKILEEIKLRSRTTIIYESPYRIINLLRELEDLCGGTRKIVLFREMTKLYEEHIGNDINSVINHFENIEPKGEFTLVIGGKGKESEKTSSIKYVEKEINDLLDAGLSLSAASTYLSKKTSYSKNFIYNLCKDIR